MNSKINVLDEKITKAWNFINQKTSGKIELVLLSLSILIPMAYVTIIFSQRSLPWWSDPGEWLMYANAIKSTIEKAFGVNNPTVEQGLYPMWKIGAWQYPPLLFFIILLLEIFLDPIITLKILGIVFFSLQPLPIFLIAKKITKKPIPALITAYASVMPIYSEMLGWGGYPNLLGLILLALTFYMIIKIIENPATKDKIILIILSILLPLTHHLTYTIYLGVTLLWLLLLILYKNKIALKEITKPILTSLIISLTIFIIYRYTLAYPSQFLTYNEAAYYELRFNPLITIPWVFKSPLPFISLIILIIMIILIILLSLGTYKLIKPQYLTLIISWSLFPIIATQGYLLGIAIDYNRIFFFSIQPIPLLLATALTMLDIPIHPSKAIKKIMKYKTIEGIVIIILTLTASINTFTLGLQTINNVNSWVPIQDPYGDHEKLAALNWIKTNTLPNETFVADEMIGKWIEGYSQRRVYRYADPRFFFLEGQLERYYIASAILKSTYDIRNGYFRIQDQNPYNQSFTPIISIWKQGKYHETLIVNDQKLIIATNKTSTKDFTTAILMTKNFTAISTLKAQKSIAVIQTIYNNQDVMINKTITISTMPTLTINYIIKTNLQIKNTTLIIEISPQRQVNLIEIAQDTKIYTDIDTIIITTNAETVTNTPDNRQIRLTCTQNNIIINIKTKNPQRDATQNELSIIDTRQIIKQNNITYIVIPRIPTATIQTWPEYQHLIKQFKIAYMNNKVIILDTRT
jgi:7-cyano-7-deazaguanine synthase in queuosine biosynthesis